MAVLKYVRLNSAHYFIMEILSKQELQQIGFNHSADIDSKELMNLYKKFTGKPYSFLVVNTIIKEIKNWDKIEIS